MKQSLTHTHPGRWRPPLANVLCKCPEGPVHGTAHAPYSLSNLPSPPSPTNSNARLLSTVFLCVTTGSAMKSCLIGGYVARLPMIIWINWHTPPSYEDWDSSSQEHSYEQFSLLRNLLRKLCESDLTSLRNSLEAH